MPNDLKVPIIVFSNVRSGSTVVQKTLDLDPTVVKWYEPRSLWAYADPGRSHDEFDERDATERVIRYIRKRFLRYQREHGGRRIVEKTPHNILKIPYVNRVFPESPLIYVVRSPWSFINSCELKWQRVITPKGIRRRLRDTPITQVHYYAGKLVRSYFQKHVLKRKYISTWGPRYQGIDDDLQHLDLLTVIAKQWTIGSEKAEAALANLDQNRIMRFKYEDFVTDPVAHLELMCRHTGLSMTDDMARGARELVDPSRQEKWRRLAPSALEKVLPVVQKEMDRHGYVVPDELLARPEVQG